MESRTAGTEECGTHTNKHEERLMQLLGDFGVKNFMDCMTEWCMMSKSAKERLRRKIETDEAVKKIHDRAKELAQEFHDAEVKDIRPILDLCGRDELRWTVMIDLLQDAHDTSEVEQAWDLIRMTHDGDDLVLRAEACAFNANKQIIAVRCCSADNEDGVPVLVAERVFPRTYHVHHLNIGLPVKLAEFNTHPIKDRDMLMEYIEGHTYRFAARKDPSYIAAASADELATVLKDLFLFNPVGNHGLAQTLRTLQDDFNN